MRVYKIQVGPVRELRIRSRGDEVVVNGDYVGDTGTQLIPFRIWLQTAGHMTSQWNYPTSDKKLEVLRRPWPLARLITNAVKTLNPLVLVKDSSVLVQIQVSDSLPILEPLHRLAVVLCGDNVIGRHNLDEKVVKEILKGLQANKFLVTVISSNWVIIPMP